MADYPDIDIDSAGYREQWFDERLISRARDGSVRGRLLAGAKKRVFTVAHKCISDADRDTVETFYDSNRDVSFNFTPISDTYVVIFGDTSGLPWQREPGELWSITLTLLEV